MFLPRPGGPAAGGRAEGAYKRFAQQNLGPDGLCLSGLFKFRGPHAAPTHGDHAEAAGRAAYRDCQRRGMNSFPDSLKMREGRRCLPSFSIPPEGVGGAPLCGAVGCVRWDGAWAMAMAWQMRPFGRGVGATCGRPGECQIAGGNAPPIFFSILPKRKRAAPGPKEKNATAGRAAQAHPSGRRRGMVAGSS